MPFERDAEASGHDEEAVMVGGGWAVGGQSIRSNQVSVLLSQQFLELDFWLFPLRNCSSKGDQP